MQTTMPPEQGAGAASSIGAESDVDLSTDQMQRYARHISLKPFGPFGEYLIHRHALHAQPRAAAAHHHASATECACFRHAHYFTVPLSPVRAHDMHL